MVSHSHKSPLLRHHVHEETCIDKYLGSQPFVLSQGDNTGYGQHGDYVFGWKNNALQTAMDDAKGCMGASCASLKTQAVGAGNACTVSSKVHEDVDGWMSSLPGMEM